MRKMILLPMGVALLLVLSACSNNANTDTHVNTSQEESNNMEDDQGDTANEINNNENESNEMNEDEDSLPDEIADLKETDQLLANIEGLADLKPQFQTDNPNKRVILFADSNNHKQYKSIFIKHKKRLKIIKLNHDDGLIFNDTI